MEQSQHPAKRRKIDSSQGELTSPLNHEITTSRDLQALLAFQQAVTPETKINLSKFRDFLASIHQSASAELTEKKFKILRTYCDSQLKKGATADGSKTTCFSDLIQTWSFADSANNESILVAVPATLAAILNTISNRLEFRDFGLQLCKYLLQKEQLRLLSRNLKSSKSKEHLISPCIRLLTEIVSFDGGTLARVVYLKRDITFSRLDTFLTPNRFTKAQPAGAPGEGSAKSARLPLRRNAQVYFLANLRFQDALAKGELIEQHKAVRAFLEFIRQDPYGVVLETIRAIDKHIAQDVSLARSSKAKFFNHWNLERLVTLYGYDRASDDPESETVGIREELHALLLRVCTVPNMGVLLPAGGWYPRGSDPNTLLIEEPPVIDLGLDSPIYVDLYRDHIPVRNGSLSSLIQQLRPESDALQIELLLAIFKAAPELVADYFSKHTTFASDPKPTASWLGESALLFSTVQLPVPANCGWKDRAPVMPPPVSVVIESILPRPLTRKVLTRCLNINADVVTIFAVRLLSISLRKLQTVIKLFAADHGPAQRFWNQAANKLVTEFCCRCPSVKEAILLFKRLSKDDRDQQEAVTQLLFLFYDVIPSVALEDPFDITVTMVDVLTDLEDKELSSDQSQLRLSQLQNLLGIAGKSTSLRWWQQPGTSSGYCPLGYQPFLIPSE
jgi:nucleolar pre-ribosomal-associated protein 1